MEKEQLLNPTFFVGQVPVYGDLILAPMDGISDMPFRSLTFALGSSMSYTEFIPAVDVIHRHPHLPKRLTFSNNEHPIVFQLCDSNPEALLKAALRLEEYHPDIIDINLGCPDRQISNRGAGAGLLREPAKVEKIFGLLSHSLKVPLSAKIRLGWDDDQRNYMEISKIIEDNGGQCIAVHGRTRKQMYSGKADWDAIAQIKQSVKIPVIANGDVNMVADIAHIKTHTMCEAVMIGRAAIANPWIFSRKDRSEIQPVQVYQTILLQLRSMMDFYGQVVGIKLFRKYLKKYLTFYEINPDDLYNMLICDQETPLLNYIEGFFNDHHLLDSLPD